MMKFLFSILVSVCFLFSSMDVSAEELVYPDYHELIGLTYDEFIDSLDEHGMYTGYYSVPFSVVNPDYVKDSPISLSHSLSWQYNMRDYPFSHSGTTSFGEYKIASNMPTDLTLTLYNNGQPLFDVGGKLTLKVYVYAFSCKYSLYYTDGSVFEYQFVAQNPNREIYQIPIEIDNSANKLSKVVFYYTNPIPQSSGDNFIGFGIVDYGYLVDGVEPAPEPEDPTLKVDGTPGEALVFITNFLITIVDTLFLLEIFTGITLGYFFLACMLLSVVFLLFFRKMIK